MQAVQMLCKTQALAQHKSNFQLVQEEEHEYDIIGHPQLDFKFVVVFPFHPFTDERKGGEVLTHTLVLMLQLLHHSHHH